MPVRVCQKHDAGSWWERERSPGGGSCQRLHHHGCWSLISLAPALEDTGDWHAQHLTESDVEDERVGMEGQDEDEGMQEMQGPPSDGHLEHPLGSHQHSSDEEDEEGQKQSGLERDQAFA